MWGHVTVMWDHVRSCDSHVRPCDGHVVSTLHKTCIIGSDYNNCSLCTYYQLNTFFGPLPNFSPYKEHTNLNGFWILFVVDWLNSYQVVFKVHYNVSISVSPTAPIMEMTGIILEPHLMDTPQQWTQQQITSEFRYQQGAVCESVVLLLIRL